MIGFLTQGPRALVNKINEIIKAVNALTNLRGDGLIQVNKTDAGYTLRLSVDQVNARMPKQTGSGSGIRMCYLAETPTDDYPLCHFDTPDSTVIDNVRFLISNGSTLTTAIPEMKDGYPVLVVSVNGEWTAIPPWNDGTACET